MKQVARNTDFDQLTAGAAQAATATHTMQEWQDAPPNAPRTHTDTERKKYVNLRLNEADYTKLKKLFGSYGLNLTDACRKAVFHLADLLEAGAYDLTPGGFFDKRNR